MLLLFYFQTNTSRNQQLVCLWSQRYEDSFCKFNVKVNQLCSHISFKNVLTIFVYKDKVINVLHCKCKITVGNIIGSLAIHVYLNLEDAICWFELIRVMYTFLEIVQLFVSKLQHKIKYPSHGIFDSALLDMKFSNNWI